MKYEFASPGWMAFMHGMIAERVAQLGEAATTLNWSICEVFTNPPASLSSSGAPLAWRCVVRGGEVSFAAEESDDVDVKVVVDYAAVVPLGRYDTRGDPARTAELAGMGQVLLKDGRMTVLGDRSKRDPRIGNLHDAVAKVTA
jgi:hypothetical protein